VETRDFPLLRSVQTGSGADPASYPKVPGAISQEVKQLGREADHLQLVPTRMVEFYFHSHICPHNVKHRDNLTFSSVI
jgi:hypothetical protein